MRYRRATPADVAVLAVLNQQLIEDERSRNRLSLAELEARLSQWLQGGYQAILFSEDDAVVAYALYRRDIDVIYLQQFVVKRRYRRQGMGRQAMHISAYRCVATRLACDVRGVGPQSPRSGILAVAGFP